MSLGRLAARHGRWDDLNPLVPALKVATGVETDRPLVAVARTTLAARATAHGCTDAAASELRAAEALVDAMSDRALAGCLDVPEWLAWVQGVVLEKEGRCGTSPGRSHWPGNMARCTYCRDSSPARRGSPLAADDSTRRSEWRSRRNRPVGRSVPGRR
ncbi:hypothetical protein GCM10029963_40650 [Micromonospora andamanensis]